MKTLTGQIDSVIEGLEKIHSNLDEGLKIAGEDKQQAKWLAVEIEKLRKARNKIHGTGTGKE